MKVHDLLERDIIVQENGQILLITEIHEGCYSNLEITTVSGKGGLVMQKLLYWTDLEQFTA